MRTPQVIIYGTEYAPKSIILVKCEDDSLPVFGEINEIFVINEKNFLVFLKLVTLFFHNKLNAYAVQKTSFNDEILMIDDLIFPHPLISVKMFKLHFVSLLNHERNEWYA